MCVCVCVYLCVRAGVGVCVCVGVCVYFVKELFVGSHTPTYSSSGALIAVTATSLIYATLRMRLRSERELVEPLELLPPGSGIG